LLALKHLAWHLLMGYRGWHALLVLVIHDNAAAGRL
jgi:hypothetical protein